jgi:hypothetical protein
VLRASLVLLSLVALSLVLVPRECAAAPRQADVEDEPATTRGDPSYADELVARARAMHLEQDVQWVRLGHWYVGASGDWRGEADGPLFYLAPGGKTDPTAELEATLRAIWDPEPADERVQHPYCRFPARMTWLNEVLHFDAARLPQRRCARYTAFAQRLHAGSVALVFSSYYLNSPASAFGHTFLRIHKAGAKRGNELLDTGVDYAAVVDTTNALLYAFKGLTGMFPGLFHALPYFYKVREYNDYESRDLWEYELDLSPRAVTMLVAHLWELGSTYFDYYYLSENCSYHVLAVVGVAEPSLHLMDHVKYPVVPVDTVRALFANKGLVRELRYRPSLRTTMHHELTSLSGAQLDALSALLGDPDAPFPATLTDVQRAQVLDAAGDVVDVKYSSAILKGDDPRVARLKQRILERRAEIAVATEPSPVPVPADKMPHIGHATARATLGTGYSPELGGFYEVGNRIALHDLADAPDGYPETSQIEFLPFHARYYPKPRSFELEDLWVIRVAALSPWERFQRPLSFAVRAGLVRVRDDGCNGCLTGDADVAGGLTLGFGHDDVFALYALGNATVAYAGGMHGVADSDWRLGIGPLGGLRWRLAHTLVWTADARWSWLPDSKPQSTWLAETTARWEFAPNFAAGFDLRRQPLATEGVVTALLYY